MKRMIIKLGLLILIGTIGGCYYLWQEATKVPDEYTEALSTTQVSNPDLPLQPSQITELVTISKNKIDLPIDQAKNSQKVAIKLNNRDVNNLVVANLAASQSNKQVPVGIKGINTSIKNGKIYTGALVNLDRLVHNGQPGSQTAALSKLTDRLPFLKDRDVYIGIVGTPLVQSGRIEFDKDTQIKVGNMNFTIAQLADNLGVSSDKIQRAIDLKLQRQHLNIDRVELGDNELAIEGVKK